MGVEDEHALEIYIDTDEIAYIRPKYEWDNLKQKFLDCKTINSGGRILHCPSCNNYRVVYHPCNKRGCPKCSPKNQIKWKNKLNEKLLRMGHYHLIINPPAKMTYYWLVTREKCINTLFQVVKESFKEYQKKTGLMFGIVMVFQSHGKGLSYKPHMHCIITPGGIDKKGRWIEHHSMEYTRIIEGIKEKISSQMLKKFGKLEKKIFEEVKEGVLEKDWKYDVTYHKKNGEKIVNYLSRTICGMVYSLDELTRDEEKRTVTVEQNHLGKKEKTVLSYKTFVERCMNHIPPKGSVVIRNYGLYSNRNKEKLEKIRKKEEKEIEVKRVKEEYIEECPECKSQMIVVEEFSNKEQPELIRRYYRINKGPPKNNEIIG